MAIIGESLVTPDNGWSRFDNNDPLINYNGSWIESSKNSSYGGNFVYSKEANATIVFYFYGTGLRILNFREPTGSQSDKINIDGYNYTFTSSGQTGYSILCFEATDLTPVVHKVVITSINTNQTNFDAIDLKDGGFLCEEGYDPGPKLTFYKTLASKVPVTVEPGSQEVHFTEKGEIFTYANDGTRYQCNTGNIETTIVKDVSNPLTTEPLEYGYFNLKAPLNLTSGVIIPISPSDSNMAVVGESEITLKKGKTYAIFMSGYCNNDGLSDVSVTLENKISGKKIAGISIISLNHDINVSNSSNDNVIVTPSEDCIAILKTGTQWQSELSKLVKLSLSIQEIRNNPVNQYGGFESQVLFEGNASAVGDYMLADDVNNYDFLFVQQSAVNENPTDSQVIVPVLTSAECEGCKVSSSNPYNAAYAGYKAFNRTAVDAYDAWLSSGTGANYLKIELPSAKVVTHYSFLTRQNDTGNSTPRIFNLEGSNDDVNWTILDSRDISSLSITTSTSQKIDFTIDTSKRGEFKFYKLSSSKSLNMYTGLGELLLYDVGTCLVESIITPVDGLLGLQRNTDIILNGSGFTARGDLKNASIVKITGYKGQLPTLLSGGEF